MESIEWVDVYCFYVLQFLFWVYVYKWWKSFIQSVAIEKEFSTPQQIFQAESYWVF